MGVMSRPKSLALGLLAGLVVLLLGVGVGVVVRPYYDRVRQFEDIRVQWPIVVQMLSQHRAALVQGGLIKDGPPAQVPPPPPSDAPADR